MFTPFVKLLINDGEDYITTVKLDIWVYCLTLNFSRCNEFS